EKRVFLVILFTSFSGSLVSRIPGAVHPVSAIAGTTETKRKPKGGVRKAKYIFEDENGETRTWSGNGKMPLALRKQVNGDCTLETFLIENPNQHEQSE
ncbi:hypothetical protein Q9L28_13195, partial [Escherichia coli]